MESRALLILKLLFISFNGVCLHRMPKQIICCSKIIITIIPLSRSLVILPWAESSLFILLGVSPSITVASSSSSSCCSEITLFTGTFCIQYFFDGESTTDLKLSHPCLRNRL